MVQNGKKRPQTPAFSLKYGNWHIDFEKGFYQKNPETGSPPENDLNQHSTFYTQCLNCIFIAVRWKMYDFFCIFDKDFWLSGHYSWFWTTYCALVRKFVWLRYTFRYYRIVLDMYELLNSTSASTSQKTKIRNSTILVFLRLYGMFISSK